ncbi:hypothetical protein TNCV_1571011 [Trichonephila clavipes]|uniref:Uncharacterized protein n=1 Tax=Trichonephila clavipes TaxID=2585209 RepID=A0A8X6VPZ4_TRICX|nr:hypothetical protein TNCV_1571011 [Trichonephila clavipes]
MPLDDRTHLYVRSMVTAVRYMDEVLETYVLLFTCVPDFILMDDNAYPLWSMNFWKVRISAERIGQLDLQTSSV